MATDKKSGKRTAPPKKATIVRSTATVQAQMHKNPETAMYEVLTPFKFQGAVVKPPTWIEMTAAEADEYQQAGVLGAEPGEPPAGAQAS